jgi:RNA polymerase sigma-70 factor (ECF subfamily)
VPSSFNEQLDVAALFEAYSAFAWRVLKRHGVAERQLEDACQEVFLVAHRRRDDFEGRADVRTWLYGIALRVALNFRRKARRARETLGEAPPEPVLEATQPDDLDRKQLAALIEAALGELSESKREVFALYEIEDMTMAEVARTLGVPENTALYRLYGAREGIKAYVERMLRPGRSPKLAAGGDHG